MKWKAAIFAAGVFLLLFLSFSVATAETYNLANGTIVIHADTSGQRVFQGSAEPVEDPAPSIMGLSTEGSLLILAERGSNAYLRLNWAVIDTSGKVNTPAVQVFVEAGATVVLELDRDSTLKSGSYKAGLDKRGSGELIICDEDGEEGSLTAIGGLGGAGIGSGSWFDVNGITITGGRIIAQGGKYAAGIGGGSHASAQFITLSGDAVVTATAGKYAAGLGGGSYGDGTDFLIGGNAQLTALASYTGSGIGGGAYGEGSNIRLAQSARVIAMGGTSTSIYRTGADIGNGGDRRTDGMPCAVDLTELDATGRVNGVSGGRHDAVSAR